MNLDSVKLKLPLSCLVEYNKSAFTTLTKEDQAGKVISYQLQDRIKKPLGVKNVIMQPKGSYLLLEGSAKLLWENYFNLVNLDSVENWFENWNKSGLIKLNVSDSIENASVLRCDVTSDLKVKNVSRSLNDLSVWAANSKYNCRIYPGESITFSRNVRTSKLKEELKFYDKAKEIRHDKALLRYVGIQSAKGILRCERRFAAFKQMRTAGLPADLKLLSILECSANPPLALFNRITKDIDPADYKPIQNYKALMEMKYQFHHKNIRKELGNMAILQLCNFDLKLVHTYLQTNNKGRNTRAMKEFKTLLKAKIEYDKGTIDNSMNEIETLLNAA